jgi:hypothetical protein
VDRRATRRCHDIVHGHDRARNEILNAFLDEDAIETVTQLLPAMHTDQFDETAAKRIARGVVFLSTVRLQ